jgi:hypothetical protein
MSTSNSHSEELKPCPLCGRSVLLHKEPSPDRTITWVRITHGPSTACGISFIGHESDAIQQWNTRVNDEESNALIHQGLPDECIKGWDEVKFCENRQGDGNQCKRCSHYI